MIDQIILKLTLLLYQEIKELHYGIRGATFQEISWNQEISDKKKELQEKGNIGPNSRRFIIFNQLII